MIVDFHTHIFPPLIRDNREAVFPTEPAFELIYKTPGSKLIGYEELLRHMDEMGIDKSVVFGFPWETHDNVKRHNDYILEAVERHPSRLVGFCCFSPLVQNAADEAERCVRAGLHGVGEVAVYKGGLSAHVIELLKDVMFVCHEQHVPFLLHTNEPVGHIYPGKAPMTLGEIYRFLKAFPNNKIILAHWGGGIFFYSLMKKEVKDVLKNVWFDTAASPYLYEPRVYKIAGEILGFEKILFGTDYPLLPASRYFKEINECGLEQHHMDLILGKNATRLLKL